MVMMGGCFVVPKILALSTVDSVIIHIIVDAGADAVKVEQWWRNRERWAGGIKVEKSPSAASVTKDSQNKHQLQD